jgi:hypothetical protein
MTNYLPFEEGVQAAQIVGLQLNVEDRQKLFTDYVASGAEDAELRALHVAREQPWRGRRKAPPPRFTHLAAVLKRYPEHADDSCHRRGAVAEAT